MSNYWTDYWQLGHLTSFGDDLTSNYTGALYYDWIQFFETISNEPISIIDIGTGNGALIDMAVNGAKCFAPKFYGIDFAKLKVSDRLQADNITFYPQTSAEKLPFDNHSIDISVSQFGIEYSNLSASVAETTRVLKAGGQIRWMIHSKDSSIVRPNAAIHEAIVALQSESGPLRNLRQLINNLAKFGPASIHAENSRAKLNQAIQHCVTHNHQGLYGTGFPPLLKTVMNPSVKFKDKKRMLKSFEHEMKGQLARLDDLIRAALTRDGLEDLLETIKSSGFSDVHSQEFHQEGKLIGYLVTGVKSGN